MVVRDHARRVGGDMNKCPRLYRGPWDEWILADFDREFEKEQEVEETQESDEGGDEDE